MVWLAYNPPPIHAITNTIRLIGIICLLVTEIDRCIFPSYLLRADTPAFDPTPYPKIANGELGATDDAANLHFKAISHPAGYIEEPPSGQLDMTFQADPCEMYANLIMQTPDGPREVDRHVLFGQRSTGEIAMNVKFQEAGMSMVIKTEKWLNGLYVLHNVLLKDHFPKFSRNSNLVT